MKKFYSFTLLKNYALKDSFLICSCRRILPSLLLVFLTVFASNGQGLEDFTNLDYTGSSYADGSFVGNNSVTWDYVQCRGDKTIVDKAICFGKSTSSIGAINVSNGIKRFKCRVKKIYTSTNKREVELFINGISQGTSGAIASEQDFIVDNIDTEGFFSIEIRNISSGGKQVAVDNIEWEAYSTGAVILPRLSLSIDPNKTITGESAAETFDIVASLTEALSTPLVVNVSIGGDNITNGDYSLSNATITIPANTKSAKTALTILNDGVDEGVEVMMISIATESDKVDVGVLNQNLTIFQHTGTENDPYTIAEAILLVPSNDVHYAGGYIVGVGNDFESPFDNGNYVTVADSKDEVDYTKCLNLKLGTDLKPNWNLVGNLNVLHKKITFNGFRDSYYGHQSFEGNSAIVDLTPANLPVVSLSVSTNVGVEEEKTEIIVTATSSVAVTEPQTLQLSVGGFQVTESDYSLSSQSITLAANSTTGSVTFTLLDDADKEADEVALITISSASDGVSIGSHYSEEITITNAESNVKAFGTPKIPTYDVVTSTFAEDYYAGIENKSSQALRDALQLVVVNSTTHGQNYGDIWLMLKEADENPANPNEVWLIYRELGLDKGEQDGHSSSTDLWNREHVWAQSLGGFKNGTSTTSDGKDTYFDTTADDLAHGHADGHHLRAAHKNENSSRGNKDFSDATTTDTYSPPLSARGDVARSLLYMEIRYNALTVVNGFASETGSHTIGDLAALLKWHTEDPVDDFEKNRNNVICEWQNNRNPFIDYPELVDYIWGDKTGQEWSAPTKEAQTITFAELVNKTYGDVAFDLNASSTSELEVSFELVSGPATLVGKTLTITGTGDVVVKATQAGNADYLIADAITRTFTVNKSEQTITFNGANSVLLSVQSLNLNATASSGLDVVYTVLEGDVSLNGNILTLNSLGKVSIESNQAGDENYNSASPVIYSFIVVNNGQTLSFTSIADFVYKEKDDILLEAIASSGMDVIFELLEGSGAIDGNTLSVLGAGHFAVKAVQKGDDEYASVESIREFDVQKATQTIDFAELANKTYGDAAFELAATSSSSEEVSFELVSGPATLAGKTLTITGAGDVAIKATQVGNNNYLAVELNRSFKVLKADQTINFESISDYILSEQPIEMKATATSLLPVEFEILIGSGVITGNQFLATLFGQFSIRAYQSGNENYNPAETVQDFGVDQATGVNDVIAAAITMYPNPAIDFVNIDLPGTELKQIKIFNLNGQIVKTTEAYEYLRLNVQDLKAGMYFISIQTDQFIVTKRFIKVNN